MDVVDAVLSRLVAHEPPGLHAQRAGMLDHLRSTLDSHERITAACAGVAYLDAITVMLACTDRRLVAVGHQYWTRGAEWILSVSYRDITHAAPPPPAGAPSQLCALVASGHRIRLTSPGPTIREFLHTVHGHRLLPAPP